MNIKKNYFNNKSLPKNIYIINSQANQKIPKRNIGYSDKNFYQISLPNHSLNFQQNTLLHSEQSTLLTSEDFHNNNVVQQLKRRNNCLCFCHKIVETIKNSNNNAHIVNCHNPEIHCHTHCFNHIKNNQCYRPIHYSIETVHNANLRKSKNFELVYNYEKIKKHYNIIRPGCYHNRNERYKTNNYTKDPSYSRNTCFLDNNYTHKRFNKSCDDIEFNYKNSHDFLVRKTRKILGFPSFDLSSKNRYVNYKPNSVKYRNEDNKIPLYVNSSQNKPNKVKNELNTKKSEIKSLKNDLKTYKKEQLKAETVKADIKKLEAEIPLQKARLEKLKNGQKDGAKGTDDSSTKKQKTAPETSAGPNGKQTNSSTIASEVFSSIAQTLMNKYLNI